MKKKIALLLAFLLSLTLLAGCDGTSGDPPAAPTDSQGEEPTPTTDGSGAVEPPAGELGGLSGKYARDSERYLEFQENGNVSLVTEWATLDGTYSVDGNTINFVSSEFEDGEPGIIEGDTITWGTDISDNPEIYVKE